MKTEIGGSIKYTVGTGPYETLSVESSLSISTEGDLTPEQIKEKQASLTKMLKEDVNNKIQEGMENYRDKVNNFKKILKG